MSACTIDELHGTKIHPEETVVMFPPHEHGEVTIKIGQFAQTIAVHRNKYAIVQAL